MKTRATPTADRTDDRIEIYERTDSDGDPQLVFYNPGQPREWINAASSATVELEDWR